MTRFLPVGYISFLFFAFTVALCVGGAPVFMDPDTAWHLAAGDLIRHLHQLPYYDTWSFTAGDERWYNLSWLFDCCISWLFEHGGFSALYTLTLVTFVSTLLLMIHYCVHKGANIYTVFGTSLLALLLMYNSILARPNMASALLTVLFYLLLQTYRTKGNFNTLLWLPVLMALWVNLHGGFLLAFAVMGIFFAEAVAERNRRNARNYGFIITACLAATLLNPYGFELYYGALRTLNGHFDKTFIYEWRAAQIGVDLPVTALVLLIVCFGNFFDRRIALVDRMLATFMLMLSLATVRHGLIAILLIMPYLTQRLSIILYESSWGNKARAQHQMILHDMQQNDIRIMGSIMAVCVLLFISFSPLRDALLKEPAGFPEDSFPVEEAAFIEAHYPNLRFYNDYNIGGYLDFLWRGKVKVFIDGRASSLYSVELLNDYFDTINDQGLGPRAQIIARQYHLDGVIIANEAADASNWLWNPDWRLVLRGPVASVYVRKDLYKQSFVSHVNAKAKAHGHPEGLIERIKHGLNF